MNKDLSDKEMIHGFAIAAESTTRLIMIITITARIAVRN